MYRYKYLKEIDGVRGRVINMSYETIIQSYFHNLEQRDYQKLIALFAEEAVVVSPLYGNKRATDFYKELFLDTSKSKITMKNIFTRSQQSNIAAAHFLYEWTMKDNKVTSFECIDIFEFVMNDNEKIKKLTIVYDTFQIRSRFDEMKAN